MEQKSKARSRVKIAVFFILTIHVVGLMALLVQGCRPEPKETIPQPEAPPEVIPFTQVDIPPATNDVLLPPVQDVPPGGVPVEPTYVPTSAPQVVQPVVPAAQAPGVTQEYVIKPGDTFYSIGKQFGVAMKAIAEANPSVQPTRLQVGQKIVIPAPAPAATPAVVPSASGEVIYTVVSGDTLSKIATKHGTTWQAIQELNNLPTTSIKVGQKLKIPAPKPPAAGGSGGGM